MGAIYGMIKSIVKYFERNSEDDFDILDKFFENLLF